MQGFLRRLTTWLQGDPRPKRRRIRFQLEQLEDRCLLSGSPLPILNSHPGAPASLYLDFSGLYEPTWGAYSNVSTPQFHLDGTGPGFTPHEVAVIDEVFQRVAETYSPFNINVTTSAPADLSHGRTQIVAIGGSYNDWFHSAAGGISYVGAFANPSLPNVSHIFVNGTAGVAQYIAIAAVHEAGHAFGLNHQSTFDAAGNLLQEYNSGDSASAPLMGLAYYATRALWWVGPADTGHGAAIQDDEAVIAGAANGFGYRPDYYGQAEQTATPLTVGNGQIGQVGVIDAPTSADYFTFTTTGGTASFTVATAAVGPTLHARLELWSAAGVVAVGDSPTSLGASISATLAAGKYYVVVRSHGGHGDVGQYTLTGLVPQGTTGTSNAAFTQAATFTRTADQALYAQDAAGNWRLLSPAGTIQAISTSTDATGHADVFALATDNSLWVYRQGGWAILSPAGTINALSSSTGDVVFVLASDHSLWVHSQGGGWAILSPAGTINALSASTGDVVFVLASDHSLWMHSPGGGWAILSPAHTINALAAAPGDEVFALASDSSLWLFASGGWRELSPAGTILSVNAGADASGSPDAFVMASDHSYWMYAHNGWTRTTAAAASTSAAPVTPKPDTPQRVPLLQDAVSGGSSTAAATKVVANPLFPHEPFMPLCMCPVCVAGRQAALGR
jgi:hypothetical protein